MGSSTAVDTAIDRALHGAGALGKSNSCSSNTSASVAACIATTAKESQTSADNRKDANNIEPTYSTDGFDNSRSTSDGGGNKLTVATMASGGGVVVTSVSSGQLSSLSSSPEPGGLASTSRRCFASTDQAIYVPGKYNVSAWLRLMLNERVTFVEICVVVTELHCYG